MNLCSNLDDDFLYAQVFARALRKNSLEIFFRIRTMRRNAKEKPFQCLQMEHTVKLFIYGL